MCVVSMIGDHYSQKWQGVQTGQVSIPTQIISPTSNHIELELLKKEVLEMKELLKVALAYDRKNNQPHCEKEDKIKLLKQVADLVGVSLNDVFQKPKE